MAGSYQVLQDQINGLGVTMEKGFSEIKAMLAGYEARTRALEQQEAGCQPIITNKVENLALKAAETEKLIAAVKLEVDAIRAQVQELQASNRLLKWFAGVVGSSVVVWLMANVLGLVR